MARKIKAPVQDKALEGMVKGKNIIFNKDGFINFMAKLGLGADNQFSGAHYAFGPFLSRNRTELEAGYRSSWVIGAVVDTIAEDMTRAGAEIVSEMKPKEITKINRAMGKLKIWHHLCNAIKWARLFGGGLAVMLIDGQRTETPLKLETIRKDQFKGLLVLDRWLVQPFFGDLVKDLGPDLGMPKFYEIIGDAMALPNMKIHYSRVIRFDGIELPHYQKVAENLWGESVVERMHDRLIAFDSVTQGAAQLVFKAYLRTIGVKSLREALAMGGKSESAVIKQFEYMRLMQTNEGITLLDSEDTFQTHQYTFAGLADMIIQFGEQISGSTGIPLVRLFGQSPAGLNSTGEADLRNYYDNVNKLQENQLRPELEKIYAVLSQSVLEMPLPEDFHFVFNPLWQMSDKEKVEAAKVVSDGVTGLYNASLYSRRMALKDLKQASRFTGQFSNITDEDIEKADDEIEEKADFGFGGLPILGKKPGGEGPQKVIDADFVESEHPRVSSGEHGGEFTSGGTAGAETKKTIPASQLKWDDLDEKAKEKYTRITSLRKQFSEVQKENQAHIGKDERAACLAVIMMTGIRPGSDKDTHAKKKAYGATTLEGRHIVEENGLVYMRFVGKKGVDLNIPVQDEDVAKLLLERKKKAGDNGRLFDTDAEKLSEYSHSLDGKEFKTKDFRTHLGTSTAIGIIDKTEAPKDEKDYKKKVMAVAKQVSAKLGNTPIVALQAYINPMVFLAWRRAIGA